MDIKSNIFTAAYDLFVNYGIKSVSMDDICRKLGISKKTLYTCISNKEDLISNIVAEKLAKDQVEIKALLASSSSSIDEMFKISNHVIKFIGKISPSLTYDLKKYHPKSWRQIEHNHFHFLHSIIYNNLKRGQEEGYYRAEIQPEVISILYVFMTTGITNEQYFPSDNFPRVPLFKQLISYHLNGIVTPKGKEMLAKLKFD